MAVTQDEKVNLLDGAAFFLNHVTITVTLTLLDRYQRANHRCNRIRWKITMDIAVGPKYAFISYHIGHLLQYRTPAFVRNV